MCSSYQVLSITLKVVGNFSELAKTLWNTKRPDLIKPLLEWSENYLEEHQWLYFKWQGGWVRASNRMYICLLSPIDTDITAKVHLYKASYATMMAIEQI